MARPGQLDGSAQLRAWLYRIATNICLDTLRRGSRQARVMHSSAEVPWLQPYPVCVGGIDGIAPSLERAFGPDRDGDWRLLPTRANRMPTAASYLRRPGDSAFRPFKFDVLRIEGGVIAEITTFGPALFPAFGLPAAL